MPFVSFAEGNFLSSNRKDEGIGSFTHNIVLSEPSDQVVTIEVEFRIPSTHGQDASLPRKTIVFQPGETSKPLTVNIIDDALYEGGETIVVEIKNAINATVDTTGSIIKNNELFFDIAESDKPTNVPLVSFAEDNFLSTNPKNEENGNFTHNIVLSQPSDQIVTVEVNFRIPSIYGQDASLPTKTLVLQPGETSKPLTINITDDAIYEGKETIVVEIKSATNAAVDLGGETIKNNELFFDIAESDRPTDVPLVSFAKDNFLSSSPKDEGSGVLTHNIVLSRASDQIVTVEVEFSVPSIYGQDASLPRKTLVFQPGETSKPFTINITDDALYEDTELIVVEIVSASNAAVDMGGSGIQNNELFFRIADNDPRVGTRPITDDDAISSVEDEPLSASVSTLLDNDTDADGDSLTITAVVSGIGGQVALNDMGTATTSDDIVVFTPDTNFNGVASFTYTVSDDDDNVATGRVSVAVLPVNDVPAVSQPVADQRLRKTAHGSLSYRLTHSRMLTTQR